jgi:hypothetical protein
MDDCEDLRTINYNVIPWIQDPPNVTQTPIVEENEKIMKKLNLKDLLDMDSRIIQDSNYTFPYKFAKQGSQFLLTY